MTDQQILLFGTIMEKLTLNKHEVIPFDSEETEVDKMVEGHIKDSVDKLAKRKIKTFTNINRINELNEIVVSNIAKELDQHIFINADLLDKNSYGDILLSAKYHLDTESDDIGIVESEAYYYIEVVVTTLAEKENSLRYLYLSNRLKNIKKKSAAHILLLVLYNEKIKNDKKIYTYKGSELKDLCYLQCKKKIEYNASMKDLARLKSI